jgi:hypothetical protein
LHVNNAKSAEAIKGNIFMILTSSKEERLQNSFRHCSVPRSEVAESRCRVDPTVSMLGATLVVALFQVRYGRMGRHKACPYITRDAR